MTKPSLTLNNIRTGPGSLHSHTLLTPPLSPASSEDVPFKPSDDDVTSLSMKKRHARSSRERRRLNRACASSTELRGSSINHDDIPPPFLGQSKSLSQLRSSDYTPMLRAGSTKKRSSEHPNIQRRRWTLPAKAQPTRGIANKVSVENKPTDSTTLGAESASPAMITLRRASIARPTTRKTSLTFFPAPKFKSQRSGVLTAFLNTLTGPDSPLPISTQPSQAHSSERKVSVATVKKSAPDVTRKNSAQPVFTKVSGMAPALLQPTQPSHQGAGVRRCSTKYISTGSVYEVIWDENISDSGTGSHSPPIVVDGRRRSIAVEKLETQLFRAVAQSRRASEQSGHSGAPSRTSSWSSMLDSRLSWPSRRESFSFQAPTGRKRSNAVSGLNPNAIESMETDSDNKTDVKIEFFPPLRSRATTQTSLNPNDAVTHDDGSLTLMDSPTSVASFQSISTAARDHGPRESRSSTGPTRSHSCPRILGWRQYSQRQDSSPSFL